MMKIDTQVRHVTGPGDNIFEDLGFAPDEAAGLMDISDREIRQSRLMKEQLMAELATWIESHDLKQVEAARILMVSRPRVSDLVNRKAAKFTIDTLIEMLLRAGKKVTLAVA